MGWRVAVSWQHVCVCASGLVVAFALLFAGANPSFAIDPNERLDDPALEQRARQLSTGLRCLVCQNQSIDDSDALLAKDLRVLVRERLVAGDSDKEVLDFVVSRYGEFVLLRPPFNMQTLLLWLAPLLILIASVMYVVLRIWRPSPSVQTAAAPQPLDESEKSRLKDLLDRTGGPDR